MRAPSAAARGIGGPATSLPFAAQIQHSFGPRHDVSAIQAHVGGAATEATGAMGASAYATGHHVAFAGAPDLHTAAHEAAHVVQQAHGVSLYGGRPGPRRRCRPPASTATPSRCTGWAGR